MPTVLPQNNKFIFSRIIFELAEAIKKAPENRLHIDQAIIIAATPTVLLNYKALEEKELKTIMVHTRQFFKRNPRFLEFSKKAVAEGLEKEWLPNLEEDDKANMLTDFPLISTIDEEGYVVFNINIFKNLTKSEHPDNETYGKNDYVPRPVKKYASKREKILLTSTPPDAKLSEKLKPYIEWYKKNWEWIHPLEDYKWDAVKHFQKHFDLESEDIASNLKEAFRKSGNLLAGSMYTPLSMLVKHARISPEDVRIALANLYDESKPLYDRTSNFLLEFGEIHKKNVDAGHFRPTDHDQQSDRATSVYLTFRYPNKHYLYKTSVWNNFRDEVELEYPPLSQFVGKLYGYEQMADQIREVLMSDMELMDLLNKSQPDDLSDGHLVTQDFMYAIAQHLTYMNK